MEFIKTVRENYPYYQDKGIFPNAEPRAMYVYQITRAGQSQTGLIAAVSVQDYIKERVKRHEHTLVAKEIKQAELLKQRTAVVKPILLAHRHHEELAKLLQQHAQGPSTWQLDLPQIDETHRFWIIQDDAQLALVQQYFSQQIQTTYIADGHHRFSAFARLYQRLADTKSPNPYQYLMCALFPSTSLQIHNFNRSVKALSEERSALAFLAELSAYADLRPLPTASSPSQKHELTFFLAGEWFSMRWRPEVIDSTIKAGLPSLDVSMFNYYILQKLLGFTDIRNDKRIKYVEGPQGLTALATLADNRPAISFCLHPLDWDSFFRVIDHGLVLPPKSTWFEPRMKNGLIVQAF